MKAKFYKYNLNFKSPVPFFGNLISSRKGLLVRIQTDSKEAFGDIPIFPDYPAIEFAVLSDIQNALKEFSGETIHEAIELIDSMRLQKQLTFGVQSALINLLDSKSPCLNDSVNLNYYVSSIGESVFSQIESAVESGYTCFKFKISGKADEIETINALAKRFGIKVRLDANRKFDLNKSLAIFKNLIPEYIDYIEEPCSNPADNVKFTKSTGINHALDETLFESNYTDYIDNCFAIVVKPSLIGSIPEVYNVINLAKGLSKTVTLSSAYESAIGLVFLAKLACSVNLNENPMGFDTYKHVESDIVIHSPNFSKPRIQFSEICDYEIDYSKVELIC